MFENLPKSTSANPPSKELSSPNKFTNLKTTPETIAPATAISAKEQAKQEAQQYMQAEVDRNLEKIDFSQTTNLAELCFAATSPITYLTSKKDRDYDDMDTDWTIHTEFDDHIKKVIKEKVEARKKEIIVDVVSKMPELLSEDNTSPQHFQVIELITEYNDAFYFNNGKKRTSVARERAALFDPLGGDNRYAWSENDRDGLIMHFLKHAGYTFDFAFFTKPWRIKHQFDKSQTIVISDFWHFLYETNSQAYSTLEPYLNHDKDED